MAKNIFSLTDDEKRERLQEHYKEDREFWGEYSTDGLFNEIRRDLLGCTDPYCLACGNKNALVDELQNRFKLEIEKALEHDQNRGGD